MSSLANHLASSATRRIGIASGPNTFVESIEKQIDEFAAKVTSKNCTTLLLGLMDRRGVARKVQFNPEFQQVAALVHAGKGFHIELASWIKHCYSAEAI